MKLFFIALMTLSSVVFAQDDLQKSLEGKQKMVEDASPYEVGVPRKGWSFKDLELTPIQSGGRIKPFDTYAREMVLFVTDSRSLGGWSPAEILLSWITSPNYWYDKPLVKISNPEIKKQLLLDENKKRFSPRELLLSPVLLQYATEYGKQSTREEDLGREPRDKDLRKVFGALRIYREIVSGHAWTVVPRAEGQWESLGLDETGNIRKFLEGSNDESIRTHFADMIRAYYAGNQSEFEKKAIETRELIEKSVPLWKNAAGVEIDQSEGLHKISYERVYNHLKPFFYTWIIYLFAALAWIAAVVFRGGIQSFATRVAIILTAGGFLLHTFGFALRMIISGRPPVTNMYESVIWVAFGTMIFATWIAWRTKQKVVMASAVAVAGLMLVAADAAPTVMDPAIRPLVPVLRSNYWLTIHVLTITLGYAAFAVSLGIGNVALFQYMKKVREGLSRRIATLNDLSYRAVQIGVVLLAAGTILGGVWADESWGRFWGWDPKEVWALIALLTYLIILHGRFAGWVGQFGFAALTVGAFLSVVMAWYGVNFILGAGLHSYGFATGGTAYVAFFCGLQILYIVWAWIKKKASPA